MSTEKKKLAPDEAWDALEKMALDDEVERVLALSDEELDDELEKKGANPARVRQRGEDLGRRLEAEREAARRRKASVAPSRAPWVAWLVAASLGGGVVTAVTMNYGAIMARLRPVPIGPDDAGALPRPSPEQQLAASLRSRAYSDCTLGKLDACRQKLDEARGLDPAGEAGSDVVELRRTLAAPEKPEKPEKPEGDKGPGR